MRNHQFRKGMAVVLAILAVLLTVLGLVIAWQGSATFASIVKFVPFTLASIAVGYLITSRRPENAFGVVLSAVGAVIAVTNLLNALGEVVTDPRGRAIGTIFTNQIFIVFILLVFILVPLWFPTGSALNKRWAWIVRGATIGSILAAVLALVQDPICIRETVEGVCLVWEPNPFGWSLVTEEQLTPMLIGFFLVSLVSALGLSVRYRRSAALERLQVRWLLFATTLAVVLFVIAFNDVRDALGLDVPDWLVETAISIGFTSIPLACAFAILRYRLYEIDRIVSRTIGYSIVVGVLVGAIALMATIAGTQFDSPLVVAATTLGVAAAFNPLRKRVQSWVDRRFNRSRYDAERVVDDFAVSLRNRTDSDEVVGGWLGVVSETLQPSSVGVWVRE